MTKSISLQGEVVQMAPDSLRQASSSRILHFSQAFYEAMSAALSREGATVSLQEQGEQPLRLLGLYTVHDETLTVTMRLRRMGQEAGTDVAVVRVSIALADIAEQLLADSLRAAATGLVADLERETLWPADMQFTVADALPAGAGLPTLKIGKPFGEAVTAAVTDSDLFGGRRIGGQAIPMLLLPRYQVGAESVALQIDLLKKDGEVIARSSTAISLDQVEEELLQPYDDRGLAVCLIVEGEGRGAVKASSRQASELLGFVAAMLREHHGIVARTSAATACQRQVGVRFRTTGRPTPDGFTILNGTAVVDVANGSGALFGTHTGSGHVRGSGATGTMTDLYIKVFTPSLLSDIARSVVICDDDGEMARSSLLPAKEK